MSHMVLWLVVAAVMALIEAFSFGLITMWFVVGALVAFIADLRAVPHPVLVGLANVPLVSERAYDEALRSRLIQLEARIASVMEAERSQAPLPRPAREVFSYSLSLLEAERSWLAERVQVSDE